MPATPSITLYHFLLYNNKVLHFRNGGRNAKSLIVLSLHYQCVPTSWEINRSLLRDPHNRERGAITPGPKVTGCMDVNTSLVWGVWVGVQFTVGRWHQPIIAITILTVHSLSCSARVCDERNHHTPSVKSDYHTLLPSQETYLRKQETKPLLKIADRLSAWGYLFDQGRSIQHCFHFFSLWHIVRHYSYKCASL